MFLKTKAFIAAAAVSVAMTGSAQATTMLGSFLHDYGIGAGKVGSSSFGTGNLNADSITVSDGESPRFGDNFDISGILGTITQLDLTLTFDDAGPNGGPLFGERWEARIFGADDSTDSDDLFVKLYDEQSPQTITLSITSTGDALGVFNHSVGTGDFFFGFSEKTWGTEAFDLDSAKLTVYGDVAAVPLPAAMPLLAFALGGLGFAARRRKG